MTPAPHLYTYEQVTWAICFFHANGRVPTEEEILIENGHHASHSASSDKMLDLIEAIIQDRIIELKRWMRLAKRNEDRKRELEILPVIGENQALLAQIKELRQQTGVRP